MRTITIHIKRLIHKLEKEGVSFYFDSETSRNKRLENVVFEKDGIEIKIYEPLFFREFGQCSYFKQVKDGFKYVDLDDETFYDFYYIFITKHFDRNENR